MAPPDIAIRVATAADVPALARLRAEGSGEPARPAAEPDFPARFAAWWAAESDRRTTWLAVAPDGATAIGTMNLVEFTRMPRPGHPLARWGYVGNAVVAPAYRDAGLGRRLLDEVVGEARRRGYVRIVLSPSERSVPFYRRAGFRDAADGLLVLPLG